MELSKDGWFGGWLNKLYKGPNKVTLPTSPKQVTSLIDPTYKQNTKKEKRQ